MKNKRNMRLDMVLTVDKCTIPRFRGRKRRINSSDFQKLLLGSDFEFLGFPTFEEGYQYHLYKLHPQEYLMAFSLRKIK